MIQLLYSENISSDNYYCCLWLCCVVLWWLLAGSLQLFMLKHKLGGASERTGYSQVSERVCNWMVT